ncbi:acyl-CoA dehydrogenase [Actinomadura sp. NBRC 104425]|uniref:acyl-CoA dehydrogenase family protein n=1 Tax=Actinomadura sp. NBRC 104425 TaxID=3032204 RepID=UPI0024A2FE59|nr:acyl-CoA dehydrogenase family protein [Actinomadura sp. NBRC 104425]GLZ13063.1 acyl-CoA dehydrogenase [Actinomadura sp. NBRC 104425]
MSPGFWDQAEQYRHQVRQDLERLDLPDGDLPDMHAVLEQLGWTGAAIPTRWGGRGLGTVAKIAAIEEATRYRPALGASLSAASLGTGLLLDFGSDKQRARWLPSLARGQDVMTICMTEPESGSHLLGMSTSARRVDGGWLLNGRKCFIGNSHIADLHGVIARTSEENSASALSAFVVESSTPGCRTGEEHDLAGLRGFSLGEVIFQDCWVPDSHLVGRVGEGLGIAHAVVTRHGKPNIGAVALGLAQSSLDLACSHVRSRHLYGRPLHHLEAVHRRLSDMFTNLYTARLALYHAGDRVDVGEQHDVGFLVGKLLASDGAVQGAIATTELMGARGCHALTGAVQLLNDALMTQAPSGTADVNRKRLAEMVLGTYIPARERTLTL